MKVTNVLVTKWTFYKLANLPEISTAATTVPYDGLRQLAAEQFDLFATLAAADIDIHGRFTKHGQAAESLVDEGCAGRHDITAGKLLRKQKGLRRAAPCGHIGGPSVFEC